MAALWPRPWSSKADAKQGVSRWGGPDLINLTIRTRDIVHVDCIAKVDTM